MPVKRDPAPARPPSRGVTVIGDDAVMNVRQLADASPIGESTIREAFKSGELEGRDVGGSTGFVTTWKTFCAWVSNVKPEGGAS